MDQKKSLKAWGLLLLLSLIWGSSFILIKKGLIALTPLEVGSIRILSASLFLLPFAISYLRKVKRTQVKYLISVGFVGSFLPAFLFAIAQTRLPSAITGVLNALTPLFTVLMGLWIYGQKQTSRVFIGILIGFLGAIILITAGSGGAISNFNFYAFYVVLATICYALNVNIIKYHLHGLSSISITSISLAFVGPVAAIQLLFFTDFTIKIFEAEQALTASFYILVLGVVGTAIALILFNRLVSLTDPVFTSSVTYIIPVIAVVWGVLDGETLIFSHIAGIVAILFGVYITNTMKKVPPSKRKSRINRF